MPCRDIFANYWLSEIQLILTLSGKLTGTQGSFLKKYQNIIYEIYTIIPYMVKIEQELLHCGKYRSIFYRPAIAGIQTNCGKLTLIEN